MAPDAVPTGMARFRARRLRLPEIDRSSWQLRVRLGGGLMQAMAWPEGGALTVLPPATAGFRGTGETGVATPRAQTTRAMPEVVLLHTRHGALWLRRSQAMTWLCLVAGLPLPAVQADEAASRLRAALAVTRLPAELQQAWGGVGCDWQARVSAPVAAMPDRPLVLRLTRGDVHAHVEAWAAAEVWQALLSDFRPLWVPVVAADDLRRCTWRIHAGRCRPDLDDLRALAPADVLRLQDAFDVAGCGWVALGDWTLQLRLEGPVPADGTTKAAREVREARVCALRRPGWPDAPDRPPVSEGSAALAGSAADGAAAALPTLPATDPTRDSTFDQGEPAMTDPQDDPVLPSDPAAAPPLSATGTGVPEALPDGIRIELVAELGMMSLTLGELRHLQVGSLVAIRPRGPAEVTLLSAPHSPVAEGFLVELDGQLGVEITRRIAS